ncbi:MULTISPECIES: ABC transporter permease [Faecalicatena]|nr:MULTISPECIES: FtsX-like permease family protein [Faecalicatena]MCI6467543.1 FtsX-like permease family protein [Faecalicatena sp.]MDY5619719.1 FtsX-like permease family protein [Lachnospiraceae bacterium]
MRLDGDGMVVGIKDAAKLIGISIMSCCAVLVCTMFLNFNLDLATVRGDITSEQVMVLYDAQVSTGKVISLVSGGCLLLTSVIMLLFYIRHYIDTHKKELGILKALGYSNFKTARNFWVFGASIFFGTIIGFCGAFLIMPLFYEIQNKDKILPEIAIHFHPELLLCLVLLPTLIFAVLAVCYACLKLRKPVVTLLKDQIQPSSRVKKRKEKDHKEFSFLTELKKNTLRSKKTLAFFILFASFCFSAMTQMSFGMKDLTSTMMSVMVLVIGLVLACTTLFLAITTVINGNTKTIAMMRTFGYSQKDCCQSLLGGYRLMAYIGFAVGTVYQYGLIRLMVDVVFRDIEGVPEYEFDFPVMILCLVLFVIIYEVIMYCYSEKIKKISVKEIMLES